MTVLVTMMKSSMTRSAGYITLNELEFINSYTFNKCIKVKNIKNPKDISQVVIFYEGINIALLCDVMSSNIITGELRVTFINKKIITDGSLGEYKAVPNKSHYFTEYFNDTLMSQKEIVEYYRKNMIDSAKTLAEQFSTSEIQVKVQPKEKVKRSSTSLNDMSPERILELKKKIFGEGYTESK